MPVDHDILIIGGGIVGLATAYALNEMSPSLRVTVLEKESTWGAHQTGHNSGVIHSGIYYRPGSLKARFCRAGNRSMVQFCQEHGIPYGICGKVIVATHDSELTRLEALYRRGLENELRVQKLERAELLEIEPHVRGVAGLRVPEAGIVDYKAVCNALAKILNDGGRTLHLGHPVTRITRTATGVDVIARESAFRATRVINCAGLHSDRVAHLDGVEADLQIVPFRGEYYELRPEARHLVRHLIYPVPDPEFPFLGVHFTRMIGGAVEAGPNAVLAFAREGYRMADINLADLAGTLRFPGFRKLARRHWKDGLEEMWRSLSKGAFVRSLQRLIPDITAKDLVPAAAGVRAQALKSDGSLVDDFHIVQAGPCLHVCNAPSPAATASLEIGRHIANLVVGR